MAVSIKECLEVAKAEKKSGKVYMMMKLAVYTRGVSLCQGTVDSGKLGKYSF